MHQETFIVGNKEYTAIRMNAFDANLLLLKIQKIVLPLFASIKGQEGKVTDIMDLDVSKAAAVLAENLSEETFRTIVFPMFEKAKVYSTEHKRVIKSPADVDIVFTAENLLDLYELIWEVARYNFHPFFLQITERFGLRQGVGQSSNPTTGS
jgi:hypothetical protein